jgi:hypothetical protein
MSVDEVIEHVDVPLMREDLDVERRAVERIFDERPMARVEGDVTVVPVVEEFLQRRFLLREEVRIARRRTEGRAVADVALQREHAHVRELPPPETNEIRISGARSSPMNPNYETPRTSAPKVAVVDEGRGVLDRASGAARATTDRARSFPVGVLLLLIVLAIALIAIVAAIF